jgi:predicted aldo/keto reductase-like oxidoreductase
MATVTKAPRKLGSSALGVFPIGLGCMSLSGAYGNSDDAEGIRVIHHAIDRGVTFLDSSDMYGWGHNETLLGKALTGGRRAKVDMVKRLGAGSITQKMLLFAYSMGFVFSPGGIWMYCAALESR